MGIPNNDDMSKFRKELEEMGLSEAQRKLNQGIYGTNGWKIDEINRFISDEYRAHEKSYQKAIVSLQKQRNVVAWFAVAISIVAIITAIFKDQVVSLFL